MLIFVFQFAVTVKIVDKIVVNKMKIRLNFFPIWRSVGDLQRDLLTGNIFWQPSTDFQYLYSKVEQGSPHSTYENYVLHRV